MRALTLDDFTVGYRGETILKNYERGRLQCPLCESDDAITCPHAEREMLAAVHARNGAALGAVLEAAYSQSPDPARAVREGVAECKAALKDSTQAPASTDWFVRYLQNDREARKQAPVARGLHGYFPNACVQVSHVSFVANEQHNPGLPMQWAFNKSSDEADCQIRHGLDASAQGGSPLDDDGLLHLAKKAWRAMAELERYCLEHYPDAKPGASVTGFTRVTVTPARVLTISPDSAPDSTPGGGQ